MGLYGLFPETDRFSAVVCDCGSIVKPQGLKNHLARNHSSTNGGIRGLSKDFVIFLCVIKFQLILILESESSSYYYSGGLTSSSSSNNGSSSRSGTVVRDKDNNYSSSNSPASSTSSTPVKNPEDFSGILPNSNIVVKHKHKHKSGDSGKSKYKSKSSASAAITTIQQQHHSSDSQPSASEQKLPEFLVNATSTSLDSSTYTFLNATSSKSGSGTGVTTVVTSTKSQAKSRHRHGKHEKSKKGEIYDPDKHCGVIGHTTDDGNKPCVRSFSCKIHSVQQRREVQGRSRNFDSLLTEVGREPEIISIDLESNSSSCSSVMEKQHAETILTEEAAMRIKEQIELPTILLRKLEHDVVQGMDNRVIAELLEKNAIVVKKEEPIQLHETITVMDTSTDGDPDQLPPQELFELISQVEEQAVPDQNLLTMEQLTNLVEETNKNQVNMFQMGTQVEQLHTELHCRTIALPLSVFYLMKNNLLAPINNTNTFVNEPLEQGSDIKFDNAFQTLDPFRQQSLEHQTESIGQYYDPMSKQIHSDFNCDLGLSNTNNTAHIQGFSNKPSLDLLSNILTLQEMVPLVPDNYCDVYSKVCDQNLLSDCSTLFPMLSSVHENESMNTMNDKQYETGDYRSIKSSMYPHLPKPASVNAFGLKRVGGGATISRKALYLRKTLLKTKDSDKKFKLKVRKFCYF